MDKDSAKVVKIIKGRDKSASTLSEDLSLESLEEHGVIKGDIFTASAKAKEMIQKAQQEADEIILRAQEEREKLRQDAYNSGHQEGLAQVTELLTKARVEYEESLKKAHQDILNLAFKIAEKIIGRHLETDKAVIADIVSQALQTVRQSRQITIRMNPEDAKAVRDRQDSLSDHLGRGRMLDILEDKKVQRGGCIIESEIGTVDAQLHTQLERLRRVLTERKP